MRNMFDAFGASGSHFVQREDGVESGADDDDVSDLRKRYRTIFISDFHLGTPGCQASALLDFLKAHPSDTLYLVGDIVDGWQLRRKWYWPQSHNDVVQKLLRRARKGCRVIYVPGNHDEFARQFRDNQFGGIEVAEETVHVTADGRQLWVIHGDYFDAVVQCAKWLAYVGDNLYEFTLKLNRHLNRLRARIGLPYWSLSSYLKQKVKSALNYVTDFEVAVANEARRRGYQGVVCGHIHRAEMRDINGILYCNDGDWVESRTALVENYDGSLELLHWAAHENRLVEPVRAMGVGENAGLFKQGPRNWLCQAAGAAAPSGLEPAAPNLLEQVWTGDRSEASGERRPARCRALHEVSNRGGNVNP